MFKSICNLLILAVFSSAIGIILFSPAQGETICREIPSEVPRLNTCIELCKSYKWCLVVGDAPGANQALSDYWTFCGDRMGTTDSLLWVGNSDFCPSPSGDNALLYRDVECP